MDLHLPVLLVEDDPSDAELMRFAFNKARINNPLVIVRDGQEGLEYLRGAYGFGDRRRYPFPCLLITDIKMPRMDGFDFLETARAEGFLRRVPAIAMSSSCLERDLARALDLGATAYYVKPWQMEQLIAVVHDLGRKWLSHRCRDTVQQTQLG